MSTNIGHIDINATLDVTPKLPEMPIVLPTMMDIKSGKIEKKPEENEEQIDIENLDVTQSYGYGMSAAIVNSVTNYMEVLILGIIAGGVSDLMKSMGINEETMAIAKMVMTVADSALSLVTSIMPCIPKNIYMTPSGTSVTSAFATSLRDMFDAMWLALEEQYFTTINDLISNLPSTEEILKDLIDMACNMAIEIADQYCYKYTGYHIKELYWMVRHYIALFKQYREMKRQMNSNGIGVEASVNVTMDPEVIKKQLLKELEQMSDLLYNCFIIVQIMDAIEQVKSIVALFHDADLTTLTENMNSFSDVMDLLVEMGLGDDSQSQVLSLAETLKSSINMFSSNAMQLLGSITAQAMSSGMNVLGSVGDSIGVNAGLNMKQMYNFEADHDKRALVMTIYSSPLEKQFKSSLKMTLSEKDEDGNQYMSNANIKLLMETVENGFNDNLKDLEIEIAGMLYIIKYQIKPVGEDDPKSGLNFGIKQKEENQDEPVLNPPKISLGVVTEEVTEDPLAKRKRPTIALVHELFAILKQFLPILEILVMLINNYKINKEKVKRHALGNLWALAKIIALAKNMNKHVNTNDKNFYTVRTLKLYDYINNDILKIGTAQTITLDSRFTAKVQDFLRKNNMAYESLNRKKDTVLYIDYISIYDQQKQKQEAIDKASEYFDNAAEDAEYPDSKYTDGDITGLDKIEYIGDEVYYTDSSLPMYGSQIWIAYGKYY